jgi:hypothetical protein
MSTGFQEEGWREFYEKTWKVRMDYMKGLIEAGETCPYRVIQSFQNYERKFEHKMVQGEVVREQKVFDENPLNLLASGFPMFRWHTIRGNIRQVPYYMSEQNYRLIIDILNKGDFDCVVDLGAGYGKYLLDIFYNGGPRGIKYIGAELTDSGREMMKTLFSMVPGADMEVRKFDFLQPDFSFLRSCGKVLFITVCGIQFVREVHLGLLEGMASAAEHVKTLHFEPFGFQIEPNLGPATNRHIERTEEKGWNTNLASILVQAHDAGVIHGTSMVAEVLGGEGEPQSLAVWEGGTAGKDG